jgi:hypothetical protein
MFLFSVIAVGIAWAPDTLLPNILEGLPVFRKQGSTSGRCFVSAYGPSHHMANFEPLFRR